MIKMLFVIFITAVALLVVAALSTYSTHREYGNDNPDPSKNLPDEERSKHRQYGPF